MEIPCQIDQQKTVKNGMKITIAIDDENVMEVMRNIYKFMDKDLIVDFKVDAEKEQEKMSQINHEQRKKLYALFKDIADATGNNKDYIKDEMKKLFIANTDYSKKEISLSNCGKEEASDFIEYTINFAFEQGIPIHDKPQEILDDIDKAMHICLKNKLCAVCGEPAEIHHVDTIGAGHNRNKVDDSDKRKIALCREHHSEAHNIGWDTFKEKYHVKGVK